MNGSEAGNPMLSNLLDIIADLSDKDYQKKAWVRGEPPGSDFDETVCQFADLVNPILVRYREFGITEKQQVILVKFREKFEAFWEENHWPPDFIDTPEWDEIVSMAKEVLAAFNYEK